MVKARQHRIGPPKTSWTSLTWMIMLLLVCTFLILNLILLAFRILSIPNSNTSSSSFSTLNDLNSVPHNIHKREGEDDGREQWVEIVSWEPRAFLYHNFLTKEECEHLINVAKPNMKRSIVVENNGDRIQSRIRTSSGTFLVRGGDKIVKNIEKRIADFSFIPVENGEGLQVIRYEVGQKYELHHDYFNDNVSILNGGQRIATMLMYLSNVEEGGETVFPKGKKIFNFVPWWNEVSDCGKQGLSIKPRMGDALLFWSMKPDATLDPLSLHGACPVIKGEKWSCAKWMRLREFDER